jgi:PAS domain S-box-containing protein
MLLLPVWLILVEVAYLISPGARPPIALANHVIGMVVLLFVVYMLDRRKKLEAALLDDWKERKKLELALRESEMSLRLTTNGARVGLWHWKIRKEELIWNDHCRALFGLPAGAEITWQLFLKAIHPEDREIMLVHIHQCLEEHKDCEIEYRILWPNGTMHWVLSKGRTTYDALGQPVQMDGITLNISDRKRQESIA